MVDEGLIGRDEAVGAHRAGFARPAAASDARSQGASATCWRAACRPRPAPPRARSCSSADEAETARGAGQRRSSWCASRPAPRTSTACMRPKGILTTRGGMTSHAAVVARGMGRPCVSGAGGICVDYASRARMTARGQVLQEGRHHHHQRLDRRGDRGRGADDQAGAVGRFRDADGMGRRGARARACAPMPRRRPMPAPAREFGAEGIGLCRTEHMFFDADRIVAVREMIIGRRRAGPARRAGQDPADAARTTSSSCSGSWRGLPVTIRLLDPPLHEFLPKQRRGDRRRWRGRPAPIAEAAPARASRAARNQPDARPSRLPARHHLSRDLRDAGARDFRGGGRGGAGDRRAVDARDHDAADRDQGANSTWLKRDRRAWPREVAARRGSHGPVSGRHDDRAAARRADGRRDRRERRVLQLRHQRSDPDHLRHLPRRCRRASSATITPRAFSTQRSRSSRSTSRASASWCGSPPSAAARRDPDIKLGICGEHGGDPASIHFCHEVGLDYVSCSPYRVPIARLAAAQAALANLPRNKLRRNNVPPWLALPTAIAIPK